MQGYDVTQWLDSPGLAPKGAVLLFSVLTIFMAIAWIQLIAGELVGCLQAFGIALDCPPALLGFTLAVVNSLGDQATNVAVARVSGKRAAFAACFSGMTFNIAISSAYGYVLYVQRTHQHVIPMHITYPTWVLWGCLVAFLVSLLGIIAARKGTVGIAELPFWVGRWSKMGFLVLLLAFFAQGFVQWSQ